MNSCGNFHPLKLPYHGIKLINMFNFRFVYGYDIAANLSFDDADNLLYAAEKYIMTTLKNQLAIRLMSLLNYDNICSLLNNPACFRHLELDRAITRVKHFVYRLFKSILSFPC